jgi:branched-chain amino acid aminotransferase
MTPALSDSILAGVTRNSVLQLARDWGYDVQERKVSVAEIVDLLKAGKLDGAFGVGTAATIAPIRTIHHAGADYTINPNGSQSFADRVSTYLDHLKRGMETDVHHWNYRVM